MSTTKPDESTEYICENCGEIVWLTDGGDGREYACECHSFPVCMLEFSDLPEFWSNAEANDSHSSKE